MQNFIRQQQPTGDLIRMAVKAAVLLIIIFLSVSGAAAYYIYTQDPTNNSVTPTPQPTGSITPTSQPTGTTTPTPQQTVQPTQISSQETPKPTVTFNYSQTNIQYTDTTTSITLKIAFDAPRGYVISLDKLYLAFNETKISGKAVNHSWSGYPLTIEFVIDGHYNGDYELRYNDPNTTFAYYRD